MKPLFAGSLVSHILLGFVPLALAMDDESASETDAAPGASGESLEGLADDNTKPHTGTTGLNANAERMVADPGVPAASFPGVTAVIATGVFAWSVPCLTWRHSLWWCR